MPDNQLMNPIQLTMEPFDPAPDYPDIAGVNFLVPQEDQRDAVGMIVYVSGLPRFYHPQFMAMALVQGWLCLCGEEGVLWSHALQGIRRVDYVSLPRFGMRRMAPDGRMVYDSIPEATAIALEIERRVFTDRLLLATLLPEQAYDWVQLITVARQTWIDRALQGGGIHQ